MTSLLLDWLNEELTLHRKVHVLERDLCNGYILAEILHLHGLENHLERYTDGADLAVRVANLELLERAMAAAGLGELGASTKRQVVMENRSCILQLVLRMKDFFESKRVKVSIQQQKLRSIPSKVYEPRSPVKDPMRVVQDVEERFIKETAKQYQPQKVQFYKDVNSAIHLRKFPQAQWQKENEQIEYDEKVKADAAKQSANSIAALRAHMKEKRAFAKDWDRQRFEKWQHTQKLYIEAERDDLRLELTLEERRKRFHAAKIADIQADAKDGVVGFEKNMSRLGLSNGSAAKETGLRAIPTSDAGAIAHLDRLSERVKELGFRPSNNVQMMKELRARRTAQLSAEKDRRMRRMKAANESNNPALKGEAQYAHAASDDSTPDETAVSGNDDTKGIPLNIQDAFMEANRETLEAHYTHLREIGEAKREMDMDELQRLRLEKRQKIYERHKQDCSSIVDDLISLAIACWKYQNDAANDPEGLVNWKRKVWLEQSSLKPSASMNATLLRGKGEEYEELHLFTQTFLNLCNVWEAFTDLRPDATHQHSSSISEQVESFILGALSSPSPDVFDTKWTKLDASKILAVFSSDERGHRVAREVALEHCLHYADIDDLLEECIKNSYDPVKHADVAASLGRRERELGIFGSKIAALRQKNSPIPDALSVEVVLAFMASTQPPPIAAETSDGLDKVQAVASEKTKDDNVGFLLHNFPRTVEEWKLFEKALISVSNPELSDEAKAERLAALENAALSQFASAISCAVVISHWEPMSRTPSPTTPALTPSPSGAELSGSAADRRRTPEPSKRQSVVDPAIAKAEAEQEMLYRRRQVEELLSRTSRVVKINQEEIHERVLNELVHLAADVYTHDDFSDRVGVVVECGTNSGFPAELTTARERRRSGMHINVRLAWMAIAKELQLNEQGLRDVVMHLRRRDQTQLTNLLKLFSKAMHALETETSSSRAANGRLDDILGAAAPICNAALEKAQFELSSQSARTEKVLIATEVTLGDAVDAQRIAANRFVDEIVADPHPSSVLSLLSWLQIVPLVCLETKEFVVDTLHTLREGFYSQFEFLRADVCAIVLPTDVSREVLEDAAKALDYCCHNSGLQISLHDEVVSIAEQLLIAAASCSNGGYELDEERVAKQLATGALHRMAAILRWSTQLVESVTALRLSEVDAMRKCIRWDLSRSNVAIGRVMRQLASEGAASWPDGHAPKRDPSRTLRRHHQAALLSASQIEALVEAFANAANLDRVSRDEFIATVVAVARRGGFPDVWQDFNNVARVAIAWSSDRSPCLYWRNFVVALICNHVGGFPTMAALEKTTTELRALSQQSQNAADDSAATLTRSDFLSLTTLWFEDSSLSLDEAMVWKSLIFSLFVVGSSHQEAEILPILFTLCAVPARSDRVRIELASPLLPQCSRGLRRALAVLSWWTDAPLSSSVGTFRVAPTQLRPLLHFSGVTADETRLVETDSGAGNGNGLGSWRRDDEDPLLASLAWCDACDPRIAERFNVFDTLAALVEDQPRRAE